MTDYKTMYTILCKNVSKAVDVLSGALLQNQQTLEALSILSSALEEAENVYIDTCTQEPGLE